MRPIVLFAVVAVQVLKVEGKVETQRGAWCCFCVVCYLVAKRTKTVCRICRLVCCATGNLCCLSAALSEKNDASGQTV